MNTLLQVLLCVLAAVSADSLPAQQSAPNPTAQSRSAQNSAPVDRKLIYSPYVMNTDSSAQMPGLENSAPDHAQANGGPFPDAPMPAFGLGGMMPQSLGMTNMPYNYMYGSAMMHPMNPMSPTGPMGALGAMGAVGEMQAMNGMGGPSGLSNQQPFGSPDALADMNGGVLGDDFSPNGGARQLQNWGGLPRAEVRVGSYCSNVRKQAVEVANAIMKRQNRIVFKELMNYLLKSKYLIGMTEVKLTRVLRKKIYGLMSEYSNIDQTNVQFIPVKQEVVVQTSAQSSTQSSQQTSAQTSVEAGDDRRKLAAKHARK